MSQQRFYSSSALPTTLTAALGASGNPQVAGITGLPAQYPFTVLVDWGNVSQEAISVTGAPTGTGPWTLPCTRGIDGTTAQSHLSGAVVVHGVTAQDFTQPSAFIDSLTGTAAGNFPQVFSPLHFGAAGEQEMREWLASPQYQAQLWDFVAAVRANTAVPGPDDFHLASALVGMWESACLLVDEAAAKARASQLIADQRALFGSLAAAGPAESGRSSR